MNAQELFGKWCGNSYEWDALTDIERQRWIRFAERDPSKCPNKAAADLLPEMIEALEDARDHLKSIGRMRGGTWENLLCVINKANNITKGNQTK